MIKTKLRLVSLLFKSNLGISNTESNNTPRMMAGKKKVIIFGRGSLAH